MRFSVEPWAPEYGAPVDADALAPTNRPVALDVEVPVAEWAPRRPPPSTVVPATVLFTDGVRRVDAWVWIEGDDGRVRPGICATFAAGAVRCDGRATVVEVEVARGLFSAAPGAEAIVTPHVTYQPRAAAGDDGDQLSLALQERMGALEVHVAGEAARQAGVDVIVVDGPLRDRQHLPNAVGYVKTHHVRYLPPDVEAVIARLAPGERTPLFATAGRFTRFSWYLRLPGSGAHAWAGVVRCEASADLPVPAVASRADALAMLLPRFASAAHKDSRAPQNLYPIAGLERELRRRLGDPAFLYRSLRAAAPR